MNKLEIYKNGNFLNAYEENAIILHKLFNYKVIESDKHKYKCGFPLTQYNKIINGLMKKNGHCPCKVGELEKNLCPCNEFIETKVCHCKLFIPEEKD